jgi:hypothetical protein
LRHFSTGSVRFEVCVVGFFSKKTDRPVRRKTDHDAWLTLDGSFAARKCKVLDLSPGGAKIKVEDSQFVQPRFLLKFARGGEGRPCRVVWRKGSTIGVEFS